MNDRIVTLTLNPSVDLASDADAVRPVRKVRTRNETFDPGGGGVNVSRVLRELGADTLAVIAAGGVSGRLLEELLGEAGLPHESIPTAGRTRVSYTVHDLGAKQEYRFVPEGPVLGEHEWKAALSRLAASQGGGVVAGGGLRRGVREDFYARAAADASRRGGRFVLDTSGPPLRAALGRGLAPIKPSRASSKPSWAKPWKRPKRRTPRRSAWCATGPPNWSR